MNSFILQHEQSKELAEFSHIAELSIVKINSIQLNSLCQSVTESIRIYYIIDGKFDWNINSKRHLLYPSDLAIILPGQPFRGEKDFMDIGSIAYINIKVDEPCSDKKNIFGLWSSVRESEGIIISKILHANNSSVLVKLKEAFTILQSLHDELLFQQIGYRTRVNHLIDELLILIARQSTIQTNLRRDFPQTFLKLEQALRQNLSYQWTVEEMAAFVGLGVTSFSERVKNYAGFSPLNYLINIRISEATKLLKKDDINITAIALATGFYSSQHFSTTFKKLTGYTPLEFRRKNILKN